VTLEGLDAEHWSIAGVDILFVRTVDDKPFAGAGVAVIDITTPPDREALRCALRFADAILLRRGKRWGAVRPSDALVGNLDPQSWHTSPFAALKHVQARP
jgi:hypothetical protein